MFFPTFFSVRDPPFPPPNLYGGISPPLIPKWNVAAHKEDFSDFDPFTPKIKGGDSRDLSF